MHLFYTPDITNTDSYTLNEEESKHCARVLRLNIGSNISLIDGKTATFLADSALLQNPKIYDFHLKNFYDYEGVRNKNLVNIQGFASKSGINYIDFEEKRILWLQKPFRGNLVGKADFLLISNNALRKLSPNISHFSVKEIIVDDSNKRYVVENLKREADSLHIHLVSLYDVGAVVVKE